MPNDDSAPDTYLLQCIGKEFGLGSRGPRGGTRTTTVAKAGSIEGDDAVMLGREPEHAAHLKILKYHAVSVEQHDNAALTAIDVMKPNAIDLDEFARWWSFGLGAF